jgi:hypothetical protein
MGLKLLHSADWHLDAPLSGFSPEQRQLLRRAQLTIPERIADLCRRECCDLVLLAGDLFDGTPSRETVETASAFVADKGYSFPVYFDTDRSGAISYGISTVPVTYFIDAEGYFVGYHRGMLNAEKLQRGIDMLLG